MHNGWLSPPFSEHNMFADRKNSWEVGAVVANPKGKHVDLFAMDIGGEVVVQDRAGHEIVRLDATTSAVWNACSGDAAPAEIAAGLGLRMPAVWAALDRLADAGLLVERASPPGSVLDVSRRKLLARVGLGMGVVAVGAQAAMANVASEPLGKAERSPEQREQKRKHFGPEGRQVAQEDQAKEIQQKLEQDTKT